MSNTELELDEYWKLLYLIEIFKIFDEIMEFYARLMYPKWCHILLECWAQQKFTYRN